jgi:hypothetical protein
VIGSRSRIAQATAVPTALRVVYLPPNDAGSFSPQECGNKAVG